MLSFLAMACLTGAAQGACAEDPWADAVVAYHAIQPNTGFDTPHKTLGKPVGGGTSIPNNSSLHSIGRPGADPGSYIVLGFNTPVTDDPANPMGLDCIVYSNAFWVGGLPDRKMVEPALIEISEDTNGNGLADDPWYVIPGSRNLGIWVLPEGMPNPNPPLAGNVPNPNSDGTEYDWGYAELTPTQREYLDNYVRPDDPYEVGLTPRSGGGDAFDIAWAVDAGGHPVGLSRFHFIRLSAFLNVTDATLGTVTPEIDAVADVAPDMDTDGDGILDEYETRVAGTDPARPESTVLALEAPLEEGGSPAGAELGGAHDAAGNGIRLYSSGTRTGTRAYNGVVDIAVAADPAPGVAIPGLIKSSAARSFDCSESDFTVAQVQDAEFSIIYTSAEIAGLHEPGLGPYRWEGDAFTQEGIANVTQDTAENRLTFRSRYTGVFVLASVAGEGDIDTGAPPIVLHATPERGSVGEPGTTAMFSSDPIRQLDDTIVADGTLFTVATTLGSIASPDADAGASGIQVTSTGGAIAFTVVGMTQAGTAIVTAASLDGVLHGQLRYDFLAGAPAGPIQIEPMDPNAIAPGRVAFMTSEIRDAYGNLLDGAPVTVLVDGASLQTPDADPADPGHQVTLIAGRATFTVYAPAAGDDGMVPVSVEVYADSGETQLLGHRVFALPIVRMPLNVVGILMIALVLVAFRPALRRRNHGR